jgi:hypothetical protein
MVAPADMKAVLKQPQSRRFAFAVALRVRGASGRRAVHRSFSFELTGRFIYTTGPASYAWSS